MYRQKNYRLGRRELEIMNIVWDLGEATVHDVCACLDCPAAYTTVLTMMRILESKGLLAHRVLGRSHVYRPTVERHEVRRSMLLDLRDLLFAGSTALLLNTLITDGEMKPEELEELRRVIESLEQD